MRGESASVEPSERPTPCRLTGSAARPLDGERGAAVGEEVLRMHLDEAERRRLVEQALVVRLAQPDADVRALDGNRLAGPDGRLRRHAAPSAYFFIAT